MATLEQERLLKSLVQDLQEKIAKMKAFNIVTEVDAHCTLLESEVRSIIGSAIKHLQKTEVELIADIWKYREETLDDLKTTSQTETALHGISNTLQEQVESLAAEVEKFEQQTSQLAVNDETPEATMDAFESSKQQIESMFSQSQELNEQLRQEAFGVFRLQFDVNKSFLLDKYIAGRLYREPGHREHIFTITSTLHALQNPQDSLTQAAIFLRNNQLLLGSATGQVTLLDKFLELPRSDDNAAQISFRDRFRELSSLDKMTKTEIVNLKKPIVSLIQLVSGAIIAAMEDHTVLFQFLPFKAIMTGCRPIFMHAQLLKNDRIAIMSSNDEIDISSQFLWEDRKKLRLKGHGCTRFRCQFGVLSNNWIVTCSNDTDAESILRLWDPDEIPGENGHKRPLHYMTYNLRLFGVKRSEEKIYEKPTGMKQVCALAVLSNDLVVLASRDGSVKLINPTDDSPGNVFIGPSPANHTNFITVLYNDHIVISRTQDSKHNLQIWNPETGKLVQTYETGHTDEITSCSLCPTKNKLVTTSLDETVRIFQVSLNWDFFHNQTT